jgi:hypothetical protein
VTTGDGSGPTPEKMIQINKNTWDKELALTI